MCSKVSVTSGCKAVKILRMPMNSFIAQSTKNGQVQSEDLNILNGVCRKNRIRISDLFTPIIPKIYQSFSNGLRFHLYMISSLPL